MNVKPLQILCIDGGLSNTMSSLVILKEFLHRVASERGTGEIVDAHKFFDVIAGSGTGGLVALLLGRLEMNIDEVTEFFSQFCMKGLTDSHFRTRNGRANNVEKLLRKLVLEKTKSVNTAMLNPIGCKSIVFAMSADHVDAALPTLFRTYEPRKYQYINCTVVEAARATTATPELFNPIEIITSGASITERFIDASTGCHNPILQVLREVRTEFPERPIGLFLSLGAGRKAPIESATTPLEQVYKSIAEDCEATAERFESSAERRTLGDAYHRLNVEQGMQVLYQGYKESIMQILAHSRNYLLTHKTNWALTRMLKRAVVTERELNSIMEFKLQ